MNLPAALWAMGVLGLTMIVTEVLVVAFVGPHTKGVARAVVASNLVKGPILIFATLVFFAALWELSEEVAFSTVGAYFAVAGCAAVLTEWRLLLYAIGGSSPRWFWTSAVMNLASAVASVGALVLLSMR